MCVCVMCRHVCVGEVETDQLLAGEDLQKADEHASIAQVRVQVPDATGDAAQVRVHPLGEGLLLHSLSLVCKDTHRQEEEEEEEGEKEEVYLLSHLDTRTPALGTVAYLN